MKPVKFEYSISNQKTGSLVDKGTFTSDKPYYEISKLLSEQDVSGGTLVVEFEDQYGNDAEYLIVKKNPKFIKNEYNNLPSAYLDSMDSPEPRYLTCVDPENNNYKFYQIEIKNGRTHVTYGRIGDDSNSRFGIREYEYDLDMYWVKYFEKISKGYVDQSEIKDFDKIEEKNNAAIKESGVKMADIKSKQVKEIVELLISRARDHVQKNYNYVSGKRNTGFSMEAVKKVDNLLDEMQMLLDENGDITNMELYKQKFLAVISVLPRYIDNVKDYAQQAVRYPQKTIDKERDLLDNLRVVIEQDELTAKNKNKDATVLDKTGLKIKPVTFDEKLEVQKRMENKIGCINRILKVKNEKTEKAYKQCLEQKGIRKEGLKLLFHGSRTENWWSIMTKGLSLNPNAVITGKMFGQGLYFAPKAEKSMGYTDKSGSYWTKGTDNKGYLALYEVAMGKEYHPHSALGSNFRGSDLHYGCHSVYAKAGETGLRNDEAIVYDERQCTIKYLIETGTERNLQYKMNLQNIKPKSFTLGEPYDCGYGLGIAVPIVMMSKAGKEELKKAIGYDLNKPVLLYDGKGEVYIYDGTGSPSTTNSYYLSNGDKEFFVDRCKDKLCQVCKLERTEEGYEKFDKKLGKDFFLPKEPDKPVTFKKDLDAELKNREDTQKSVSKEMQIELDR